MNSNGTQIETRQPLTTATVLTQVSDPGHHQPQNNTAKVALYQKLLAVMKECDYIQKDRSNSFHKYNYASEAAIKARLHESLVKNRLLFFPSASVHGERTERTVSVSKDGKESSSVSTTTTLQIQFRFIDADTGEFESGEFVGTGSDSGDKGAYKAVTGAIKYILTSWFLIPTGDDPEEQRVEPQRDQMGRAPQPRDGSLSADEARELEGLRQKRSTAQAAPPVDVPRKPPNPTTSEIDGQIRLYREKAGEVVYMEELDRIGSGALKSPGGKRALLRNVMARVREEAS